ncbi:Integrase catalytic core [Arabidopsis thaliana x Arabidopsis arenosa]|uniref:Integrase catalytic core n=1 Tax=Arabidopsis thaliana x Arabidopsis arenosa TaxID=1240361 RepID=A0A8T1ZKZ3_9BRAS|nr:Integrase catalytic core [Arabidopsis thaliana x Arabidopsis arenosa]
MTFDITKTMKKPTIDGQVFYIEEMDRLADELLEELTEEDYLQSALTKDGEEGFLHLETLGYKKLLDSHKEEESSECFEKLEVPVAEVSTVKRTFQSRLDLAYSTTRRDGLPVRILKKSREQTRPASSTTRRDGPLPPQMTGLSSKHLSIEPQRRLNPNLKEVVKKEILKLLDADVIYPISDSTWVSPVHCVPKKGGMTVVRNEKDELIPTRTITGHRMCIDYRKLNAASRKDHFPLPFIDQMLERLANHPYYCFLDGYSGFFQIPIHPNDQEKTTFTCPYGTFAYKRMPFGLCNAPATFQRCMTSIFSDLIEEMVEVFMDDFSVYGSSFSSCLLNLCRVLARCEETNLVLNWEKCHFMVREGIVLGHKISEKGIEVDKGKIEVMMQLQPPKTVKDIRSFLGHVGFYRRFIKDFSKIARPLTRLLCKEAEFEFDEDCLKAFHTIKEALVTAPVVQAPNWDYPFEIMCDASDYAVGAVLGQRIDKKLHVIYYASRTLDKAQGRWILLLQEFDMEIVDKKGIENGAADHLSRMRMEEATPIDDSMPEEQLLAVKCYKLAYNKKEFEEACAVKEEEFPWYADLVNYLICGEIPKYLDAYQKKKFFRDINHYYWDEPYLYKKGTDGLFRRCIAEEEVQGVLEHCHGSAYGGHFATFKTVQKVLQAGLWWPSMFKDAYGFIAKCDPCQRMGNITRRNEMQQNPILEVEVFDVWGIDFMGPFNPASYGNKYILVAVDYVSKWVEAIASPTNDHKVVLKLFKSIIFPRFGIPKAVISDGGSHFINKVFESLLKKHGVKHKVATPYHPQTSGQVEVSNRQIKAILARVVGVSKERLMLYGKSCHLPVEVEYKAIWATKLLNLDIKEAQEKRSVDLHELEEIRLEAYESSKVYKERTKAFHDKKIVPKDFKAGDQVLLFNSRLKLFPGKLKSRWSGPFTIKEVLPFGNTMDGDQERKRVSSRHAARGFAIINERIPAPAWTGHASFVREDSPDRVEREVELNQGRNEPTRRHVEQARRVGSSSSRNDDAERVARRRREISRGKRVVEADFEPTPEEDAVEMEEEEAFEMEEEIKPAKPAKRDRKKRKPPTPEEYYSYLKTLEFEGTRHPHRETMAALGIAEDIDYLAETCGLKTFLGYSFEGYQEETCQLLATLDVHFYADEQEEENERGFGYITFSVKGRDYSLTIRELNLLYGFPSKEGLVQDFDKRELQAFWKTIAGPGDYKPSKSKSSSIRSPVVRYLHQSIASMFFAKKITGTISEGELQLLDLALLFTLRNTSDGAEMVGDRGNAPLIAVFLDHLLGYKEYAANMHRSGRKGSLTIGGILTPILVAANIDVGTGDSSPTWIDMAYLRKKGYLDKTAPEGVLLYVFNHPEEGTSRLLLPCTNHTTIRAGENIDFCPPSFILYDSQVAPASPPPQAMHEDDQEQTQDAPDDYAPERFFFEEYKAPRQTKGEREAHKRIGLLQGLGKFQGKAMRGLSKKVDSLTTMVKKMALQITDLQKKSKHSPSSSEERGTLRRSGSSSMAPRHAVRADPPRYSSFEPRQRESQEESTPLPKRSQSHRRKRKVQKPSPEADSTMELDDTSSQHVETAPEPTNPPYMQDNTNVEQPPPESSTAPSYTQESMDEYFGAYFGTYWSKEEPHNLGTRLGIELERNEANREHPEPVSTSRLDLRRSCLDVAGSTTRRVGHPGAISEEGQSRRGWLDVTSSWVIDSENPSIKHLLRADKLQNLEEVCSQIQKEQGSLGLFGSKGELVSGNSSELTSANRGNFNTNRGKAPWCDHCKKSGHAKEKCWILHPHLRPARREPRANHATGENLGGQEQAGTSSQALGGNGAAMMASSDLVRRSDLDALIKALKESSGNAYHALSSLKPLIVDSGASHHMISDSKLMKNIEPALGNVIIANGDKIPVKGLGDLELFSKKSKAFYMPTFTSNLLSVKRATTDLNCYAIFGRNDVHFQDIETSRVLGHGGTKDGLYVLEDTKLSTPLASHFSSVLVNANNAIWHARLGHPHSRALGLLLPSISFKNDECEACILGKHCKSVFPKSNTIYENCFDLVHSDVWTSPCLSRENQKYFVTFIDEKSKYTWLTLLPSKDRVLEAFTNFQNYVTNHYNAKIKIFRSDNGGEYTSHAFKQHLAKHGIIHQTSCPYTPQQNGVAERKNRHLMEVARSMMFHTNVPKRFWSDAVVLACYLINRIPTKILQDSSPFEVLNKNKPSINHLRVFGCVCFVLIGEQRSKLDPKSVKGMFIGYSITQKGYKCYIPETKKVLVSRDVKFVESKGYYEDKNWEDIQDLTHSPSDRANNLRIILERLGVSNSQGHTNSPNPNPEPTQQQETSQHEEEEHLQEEENIQANIQENILEEGEIPSDHEEETTLSEEENLSTPDHNEGSTSQEAAIALRRSERLKFPPSNWKNTRVYYNSQAVAHPIQAVCTIAHFPEEHQVFLGQIDQHWIPQTYEEAIQHQVWRDAIAAERQAMEHNHTWEEGELPRGKKAVTSKWVFTIKYKSNGDIERYKARLVARGFTQTYGEDYRDTFAPVAKLHTVRVVLSLATNLEWELWQMDVKNAFLQGELEEEVYMKPPPGLEDHNAPGKVFKLKKAIYGLKQSPRAWYHKLSTTLLDRGFKKSEADNTLFTLPSKEGIVVILVYVDDIIISGNDKVGIQETKAFLKSVFDIKDLGELKYFLGIEVCRSKEGLFLSQRKYTLDLLSQVGKLGAKPAKTPLEDDYKANRKGELDNKPFEDVTQYQRLVGKLIYLTITRPDICFAVNVVSQHMQAPTLHHWNMVTRILKYLKGAPGQGIWMGCNKNTELVGYCDADYAGDTKDRRSTTGYCTFIGGNLVTWRSKKQKVVSLSSAEAEYRAMRKLTTELMWLKALLKDFGIDTPKPITMHCDNQAAIHIASNSVFHERTKHIEVDCHKVREQVQLGVILPCYTESEEQLADIFTKGASTKVCEYIHHKLGLVDLSRP